MAINSVVTRLNRKLTFLSKRSYNILLLLVMYATTIASQETNVNISCQIVGQSTKSDELLEMAQKLIVRNNSSVLDSTSIEESLRALQVCRLFETVEVEQSPNQVKFLLTPARYVRDIRIKHELPLFEDEIEKAMSTYPGDVFSLDILTTQDSLITSLYQREGFVCPQVDVSSSRHPAGDDQIIFVRVKAGEYYRLNTLEIRGNKALSDFHIKRNMKSWRSSLIPGSSGRFVESVFREDLKTIFNLYKTKRFADVEIQDSVVTDSLNRSVQIILSVNEGNRYKVTFTRRKDRGYRKSVLRKDIGIFKIGNRNDLGAKRSVKTIKNRMDEAGFLDAQVSASDTIITHRRFNEQRVKFAIFRNSRTTVSSIAINGATSLGEETIRGQMLHVDKGSQTKRAYNPDRLEQDVFAVQMLYHSRGYLSAAVTSSVTQQDKVVAITIDVNEGSFARIGSVYVDTTVLNGVDIKEVLTVTKGDPYRNDILKRDANLLQAAIAEHGYPHVEAAPVVTMSHDSSSADVKFQIAKGPIVTMGAIHFSGNFHTRERVLEKQVKTTPGDPLSLRDIVDTQKELRDLDLFSSVRFRTIGLREKQDTVHVFVELSEKRPYYGVLGGGYQSDKGAFAHTKIGNHNVFGLNKDVWVRGDISVAGERINDLQMTSVSGALGLLEPRFLGSRIRALIEIYGEKESMRSLNYETTGYGISSGLISSLGKYIIVGLGARYERRQNFYNTEVDSVDTTAHSNNQLPRNIVTLTPSFTFDRRDSFTRPRKGTVFTTSIDLSNNLDNSLDDIVAVQVEAKGYVTPFPPLTFATVVRGGYLYPYGGSPVIPDDKYFYLGGTGDLRGFDENLFHPDTSGGTTMLIGSIEARTDIGFNIELASFYDVGRLEDDFLALSADQFRSSAGVGIRYITPIGPIGLLYGWKLYRKPGEEMGAFHFSIGYTY